MSISVAIIARNSEDVIEKCLESVKDADEIVVVDTGSDTDETINIAKKYTHKVYTYYGCNEGGKRNGLLENFADARNKALEYCTMSHILTIDCDEVLENGAMEKLKEFNGVAVMIRCINELTGEEHLQPRLYKNSSQIKWKGAAHNYLEIIGAKSDIKIIYSSNKQKKNDPDRTMRILTRWIKKHPKDTREMYYLAKEYHVRNWFKKAFFMYKKYIRMSKFSLEKADAYVNMARCLAGMGKRTDAINATMAAISINPTFPEALYLAGDLVNSQSQRMKFHYLAGRCTEEDLLFKRKRNKPRITVLSLRDFAGSGSRIVKAARIASEGTIDIEMLTHIKGSTFGIETGCTIAEVGWDVARERIQTSDIIHFKGDWVHNNKFPEIVESKKLGEVFSRSIQSEQIYLPTNAKRIYTVCGSLFRKMEDGLSDSTAWECYQPKDYKADYLSATTPDLCYNKDWHYMPFPYLDFQYCFRRRKKFRIMHIPSTPEKKGTEIVQKAIKLLEKQRSDFEYIELTGLKHEDCLAIKSTANIYLDQFVVKAYGNAAVEAMAMGIPVISGIDYNLYDANCPVVSALNAEDLAETISLMMNWNTLQRLSETTYRYATEVHGGVGAKWFDTYMKLLNDG
jgi:glycosyltransferase involved in cell wall biosynthesis